MQALQEHHAVYFGAIGGLGAILSADPRRRVVAYEDLGTEAIRRLVVEEFPAIVINDCYGGDFYREGVAQWRLPGGGGLR